MLLGDPYPWQAPRAQLRVEACHPYLGVALLHVVVW